MQQHKDERSLGELFSDLSRETSELVRSEVQLAKNEMTERAKRSGKDVGFMAAGGALLYAGLLAFIAGIIVLIGHVLAIPYWVSAIGISIIVMLIGYMLVRTGMNKLKQDKPIPQETVQTLKEDKEWAKDQTR